MHDPRPFVNWSEGLTGSRYANKDALARHRRREKTDFPNDALQPKTGHMTRLPPLEKLRVFTRPAIAIAAASTTEAIPVTCA